MTDGVSQGTSGAARPPGELCPPGLAIQAPHSTAAGGRDQGKSPAATSEVAEPILEADLSAGYKRTRVLEAISFSLRPGQAMGLVGTSGAGKSTLLLALLGLLPWKGGWCSGQVLFEGKDLLTQPEKALRHLRGNRFALIPQSPLSALNPVLTIGKHLEHAWRAHAAWDRAAFQLRVAELFENVQLSEDLLRRRPGQISVGQAQRVLIAMALLHRPALLLADEPTSALDPATQTEIVRLLRRLHRAKGTALLYISHDLPSVLQLCDGAAVLDGGRVVETLATDQIETEASHPATLRLLRALPAPPEVLRSYQREGWPAES